MASNLLPPTPQRTFADHEKRLAFLERRIDEKKAHPPSRRTQSALVTVAASDTPETLAANAMYRCDGTDDQTEINAALAVADGGLVVLLEGTFSTSASVAPRDGVRIMGAGATVTYSGVGYAFDCVFGHGATLERLTVTATAAGAGCFRSELGEGIVALDRCILTVDNGSSARPAVSLSAQNASIVACTIEANGAVGVYVLSGSEHRAWIAGNCITASTVGVDIDGARDTRVVANWIDATSHGIHVYANADHVLLTANVIQAGGDGVLLEGADHTSIQGNTVVSAGGWGIRISDATSSDTFWTDNHVVAATSGDFSDAGTGTIGEGGIPTFAGLTESDIPAEIARDTEVATAVSDHAAAADPHTAYQKESEKGAANGYAGLDGGAEVPTAQLASGTADATTFLRGDQTWATPAAGGATFGEDPGESAFGDTAAEGASANSARADHVHGRADDGALFWMGVTG